MHAILTFFLFLFLLTPVTQPLAMPIKAALNRSSASGDIIIEEQPTVVAEEPVEIPLEDKILSSMLTVDLDGYATIGYPVTYFTYNNTESTGVYKQLDYMDNKSRIYMSYITGMAVGADVPGYIANDLAKVDTYTNNKVEQEYNGVEWMKITADKQIDDCNVYIYYTLNNDSTSAFWMKIKVKPDADDEAFNLIVEKMLNSFNRYAPNGSFLFDTPANGYYADHDVSDGTEADTSGKMANNNDNNQVFKYRGGYVLGADISDNWDDLEIIIDGTKFKLPASLSDFLDAGFVVNDTSIRDKIVDQKLARGESIENIDIKDEEQSETEEGEDGEEGDTEENVEETTDENTTKVGNGIKSEEVLGLEVFNNQTISINLQNANGTVIVLEARNSDATKKLTLRECDIISLTLDSTRLIDRVSTSKDEVYNEITELDDYASKTAKDDYNHELILARGVTWDAYVDEIERIYTAGSFTESLYSSATKQIIFTSGPKSMVIRLGNVKGITYIKMSCTN